jgi:hypothetical protein
VAGGFTNADSDQWPNFTWLRDTSTSINWDEGLIKASSTRGVFGKTHFGIHFHSDRSFAFHTSGWDTEMEINGDGTIYMKGPVGIGTSTPSTGTTLTVNGNLYTSGILYFGNSALVAAGLGSTTNIDHIWHDDGANAWNFCSDTTYRNTGNSTLRSGHLYPGATNAYDLGSSDLRWRNIYTQDLHLSNGIGDYTIVEGEEDLYLTNNKTGKAFKFALIEVEPSEVPEKSGVS